MAHADPNREREEQMELAVVSVIVVCAVIVFAYFYYIDAWYFINLYLFKGLSYAPSFVHNVLFFWYQPAADLIPRMAEDLSFHRDDYYTYYIDNEVGDRKLSSINTLLRYMFVPYLVIPIIFYVFRELTRKKGGIKAPGQSHSMYSFARSQKEIWVYIKPVVNIMEKMTKNSDLDSGWYAMSKLPIMWVKERDLLKPVGAKKKRKLFTVRERSEFTLDKRKAFLALKENLGVRWTGLDDLTFDQKCCLAVITPHIFGQVKVSRLLNRRICALHEQESKLPKSEQKALLERVTKEVDEILDRYRDCFVTPHFDNTEFDEPYDPIVSSFEELDSEKDMFIKGSDLIKDILLHHAYVKTVFFALIERSWTYGVLSSSELLWLKVVDRDLFYVLSQQGRTSSFIEVCGAWSHYLAEDTYGFKMITPQVNEGIRAIDYDLFKTHSNYSPHERWIDTSKWDKLVPDSKGKSGLPNVGSKPSEVL